MNIPRNGLTLAIAGTAIALLVSCGGSPSSGTAAPPVVTTSDVPTTVIDGAIRNALVCMDKNRNGDCDASEPQGRTDASGNVTLKVDKADVGKFPLLTLVGTDAVDADHGPVTEPFAMTTPPGKSSVISPLTTMVALAMETGATEAEAEATVKAQTGITVSLFEDFVKVGKPATGQNPGDVARMIVVTTQEQNKRLQTSIGTQALDGSTISKQDLQKAVFKKVLQILPEVVTQMNNAAGAGDQKAKEAAVRAGIVASLMDAATLKTEVGIEKQAKVADPTANTPTAGFSLRTITFTDANNWFRRTLNATLAQATPDASGWRKVVDRRERMSSGVLARWNFGGNPADGSNQFWNGSAWQGFPLNFEWDATVVDANGNNNSSYGPKLNTSSSKRATFDVSGRTMASVYDEILAGKYTNYTIANPATVLAGGTFPTGSTLTYITSQDHYNALAYNTSNNSLVFKSPQAVGGNAITDPTGICNATGVVSTQATTLEELVSTFRGNPCIYNQDSFTNTNGTFNSGGNMEVWGNQTLSYGTLGTAPVLSQANATSYYTTNTYVRLAFTGTNEVNWYTCKQRQVNGFTRTCTPTGEKSTWTITTLGDGSRVMQFSSMPAVSAPFTYIRTFVERSGIVYYGYQDKLVVVNSARLNTVGAKALFTQLGLPTNDQDVPMALTAASYQGGWDMRAEGTPFAFNVGIRFTINGNNTVSCTDNTNGANVTPCTLNISNPATGAFTSTFGTSTQSGLLNYVTGKVTGTFSDPTGSPTSGNLIGERR